MTKKLAIGYTFLFLFVFTFALSLTLATQAHAEMNCCVVEWCPGDPPEPALEGVWKFIQGQGMKCVFDPAYPQCMAYICEET